MLQDELAKEQLQCYEDWYNRHEKELEKPEPAELLKFFKLKVSRVKEALDTIPKSGRNFTTSEKRRHRPISPLKLDSDSVDEDPQDTAIRRNPPNLISPQTRRDLMVKQDREESDEEENRQKLEQDTAWQEYKTINANLMHGVEVDPGAEVHEDGFMDLCFSARTEFTQPVDAHTNIDQDDNK